MEEKIAIKINTSALGDSISAIPTINRLFQIYEKPITVFNDWSHLLKDHPSVLECKKLNDSSEGYLIHNTFKKDDDNDVNSDKKHNAIDIRQFHAWDIGVSLTGDEMNCDLYCETPFNVEWDNCIMIHPSTTWDSRTWSIEKWKELVLHLVNLKYKVVIVGNDIGQIEYTHKGEEVIKNIFDIEGAINLTNKTTIPELRWLMNNKTQCLITMDSGILHVAGTTDCNIIQLGSSINYKLRAPWRKGRQDYKYYYVGGSCNIFCGSDLKYGLKEHDSIHGIPLLSKCQEEYEEFLCHPNVNDVLNKIINIDNNKIIVTYDKGPKVEIVGESKGEYYIEFIDGLNLKLIHSEVINNNMWTTCSREWFTNWVIKVNGNIIDKFQLENKKVYIQHHSKAMGDTIAWAPYAVEFMKKHKCKVILTTHHNEWFKNIPAYKDIKFVGFDYHKKVYAKYNIGWFKNNNDNNWNTPNLNPNPVNQIPLQQTATDILGLDLKELNYGVDIGSEERPINEKYVVFGPQATAGCKEWDIKKWEELSVRFINAGYKVVICSLNTYNMPNTIECNGTLEITATYLKHADIFIGLGSGLSWLNWALGKRTYMINGFAKEGHEFTSNLVKITNNECIKCWNDPVHVFDPSDWNWCPEHKGTKLQHICQQSITVNQVFDIVKNDFDIN